MRYISILLLVLCSGCAASSGEAGGQNDRVTALLSLTLQHDGLTDAASCSLDQFLNLYVVDRARNAVIKYSPRGDSLRALAGFGTDHYQFNSPVDIDARLSNNVLIADNLNHRVERYTKDLAYVSTFYTRDQGDPEKKFGYPKAIAADDAGNLYVADGDNKRVLKVQPDLTVERIVGSFTDATRPAAIITNPIDLAVDRIGRLLVLDNGGTSIVQYDILGNFLTRIDLRESARALATSSDTIFALNRSGLFLQLLNTTTLTTIGRWAIQSDSLLTVDLAARNGKIVLLTAHAAFLARPTYLLDPGKP